MRRRKVRIERERALGDLPRGVRPALLEIPVDRAQAVGICETRECMCEARVDPERVLVHVDGRLVVAAAPAPVKLTAAQVVVVRADRPCGAPRQALALGGREFRLERARDPPGDLALYLEDVVDVPVVGLRPEMRVGGSVDELARDADARPLAPNAPLEYVAHAELLGDLTQAPVASLVAAARRHRDDTQASDLGELRDDVLGHPVGEVLVRRVGTQALERQHRDVARSRRLVGRSGPRGRIGGGLSHLHRRDESVAEPAPREHVALLRSVVPEASPQLLERRRERRVVHHGVRPDVLEQLVLRDGAVAPFHEVEQEAQRRRRQRYAHLTAPQLEAARVELELVEY